MEHDLPLARRDGLATEQVRDELLVYDLDRDKVFCLNRTAALVWKHCDGRTSPVQMAKLLRKEVGGKLDEKAIWYAVDQLGRDRLLEERLALPAALAGMTRRQHLRALGKVAAVAVPLVVAVTAPTPALAACGGFCVNNAACTTPSCSHCHCSNGVIGTCPTGITGTCGA